MNQKTLALAYLDTPLGQMIAIADDHALYLLEFTDKAGLENEIEKLHKKVNCSIFSGYAQPIKLIESELKLYFSGNLTQFTTPICLLGTPFQKMVWQELQKIPFGQTCSYAEIAHALNKAIACRAVAQANSANQLPIIIPCHRVIRSDGILCGYSGGVSRKKWLIEHEEEINMRQTIVVAMEKTH